MQQELFYLSLILCLGLIVTAAVSLNKYINMKLLFESADKTNDNLLQERMTLQKQIAEDEYRITKIEELSKKYSDELTEVSKNNTRLIYKCDKQAAEINSLESINKSLLADNRKLAERINPVPNKIETKSKRNK